MAVYAIGDVQGCFDALTALLQKLSFDPSRDRLWFVGDLVNRGPKSLETLRFVRGLGDCAVTVLGNHDLHLLAVAAGKARPKRRDTLDEILAAPDRESLLGWLRRRPLFHHDAFLGCSLVHAGLLPQWDLALAQRCASEVEAVLRGPHCHSFFEHMYGNLPDHWNDQLHGDDRLRVIVNGFTRLRFCDLEGAMDLHQKGAPGTQPPDLLPWYQVPNRQTRGLRIVFGHWSTLGVYQGDSVLALDSGCVWGEHLTASRIDCLVPEITQVACPGHRTPGHDT